MIHHAVRHRISLPRMRAGRAAGIICVMDELDVLPEPELLALVRGGDRAAFERLVATYRGELYAHCYRMLGSVEGAEDALQESLLGAWKGMAGFEGRSSLRAWLYRVSTNACLRLIARRPGGCAAMSFGYVVTLHLCRVPRVHAREGETSRG
jgi:DNA-directed RNA polymerase specialized sigma24 family protein